MSRATEDTKPKSFEQAKEYLQDKQEAQDKQDVQRAFRLAKRDEEVKKTNDLWMSSFKQLTNT